jgi:hypothetical protein
MGKGAQKNKLKPPDTIRRDGTVQRDAMEGARKL